MILQEAVKLIISWAPLPGAVREEMGCDSENACGLEIHGKVYSGAGVSEEK